jgi:hypothetical protein
MSFNIEKTSYGIKLTFDGVISAGELQEWLRQSKQLLDSQQGPFCVFVDLRTLPPVESEGRAAIDEGQRFYRSKGMVRSVVILENPVTTAQFKQIAHETGIAEWERYIDASSNPDWEAQGMAWLTDAIEPDQAITTKSTAVRK